MAHPVMAQVAELERELNIRVTGQHKSIRLLLAALLARGHVLLEDMPGTGKTTLAKALAACLSSKFSRIQFTPDLMPTDITGSAIYNQKEQSFDFHPGPIFCNILLADEINRASPRTQSALLEAMEERQVSTDGKTLPLPESFFVCATENPVDMHGTYPLPEAQLDRFTCKLSLGYVSEEEEVRIILSKLGSAPVPASSFEPLPPETLLAAQRLCLQVHVSEPLALYAARICRATRSHEAAKAGASARGSIALIRLAQALALLDGREHALPKDIQAAAVPCLAHRCILRDGYKSSGKRGEDLIVDILRSISAPH